MAIRGSCLCGGVTFEVDRASGPAEFCHCNRCRKASGSSALLMVRVDTKDYRFLTGRELVKSYAAPILYGPPAYHSTFCSHCGSPVPTPPPGGESFEIPAGAFDDDPGIRPDKHIFVDFMPPWTDLRADLPAYTLSELYKLRTGRELPKGFVLRSHASAHPPNEKLQPTREDARSSAEVAGGVRNVGSTSIREYQPGDLDRCRELWRSLTQRHRDVYDDPTLGGPDPGIEFDECLGHPQLHRLWVAELERQVLGLCGLVVRGEESELEPIVVDPSCRSRGIGALLAQRAIAESRRLGVKYVNVRPVARNLEAIRFFHREGFRLLGRFELSIALEGASPFGSTRTTKIRGLTFEY